MKKFTLILATVALLAAGCSKTEVVGPQNRKGINFAAYTAKTTKAAQEDVTTENLENFEVTAFGNGALYFDDVTFKKNRVSTVWESTTKYFWPAFPLTFYAFNTPYGYHTAAQRTGFTLNITKEKQELIVNYENCLECGACRVACEKHSLHWEYPKGTKGVTFKQG